MAAFGVMRMPRNPKPEEPKAVVRETSPEWEQGGAVMVRMPDGVTLILRRMWVPVTSTFGGEFQWAISAAF